METKRCEKCGILLNEDAKEEDLLCENCKREVYKKLELEKKQRRQVETILTVISFLFPLLGIIFYLVEPEKNKMKIGRNYLLAAVFGFLITRVGIVLLYVIYIMSMVSQY